MRMSCRVSLLRTGLRVVGVSVMVFLYSMGDGGLVWLRANDLPLLLRMMAVWEASFDMLAWYGMAWSDSSHSFGRRRCETFRSICRPGMARQRSDTDRLLLAANELYHICCDVQAANERDYYT